MRGRVGRHLGVPVDRVAADEVVRVDHALGVRARRLAVEPERAEHRRRRRLARGRVVDPLRRAVVGQHEDLARPVELDVLAGGRVAQLVAAATREQAPEDRAVHARDARHAVHLAVGDHRAPGGVVEVAAARGHVVEPRQGALEQAHVQPPRADVRARADRGEADPAGLRSSLLRVALWNAWTPNVPLATDPEHGPELTRAAACLLHLHGRLVHLLALAEEPHDHLLAGHQRLDPAAHDQLVALKDVEPPVVAQAGVDPRPPCSRASAWAPVAAEPGWSEEASARGWSAPGPRPLRGGSAPATPR